MLFISFIQCCVYSKILSYSTAWSVFGSLFSKHLFWVYGERNEKKKIAVYAICQVTDVPKDTPIKCMINWFRSNHSNPKMWKSKLKIQGEVVTRIGRKLTEKVLTLKQLMGSQINNFPSCGFSKNVSSRKRLKPWFFVIFNIIKSHIFPENFIEIYHAVQKCEGFSNFLTFPCSKKTNDARI